MRESLAGPERTEARRKRYRLAAAGVALFALAMATLQVNRQGIPPEWTEWMQKHWGIGLPRMVRASARSVIKRADGSATAEVYPDVASTHPVHSSPYRVQLIGRVTLPESVPVDESFVLEVQYSIEGVYDVNGQRMSDAMQSLALFEIRPKLRRWLRGTLAIAGMDVAPSGAVAVADDLAASWSVRAHSPGKYRGVLKTELSYLAPELESLGRNGLPRIPVPGDLTFGIEVEHERIGVYTVVGWAGAFLGPLLTLPGLFAFSAEWRRRRDEKRRKKADEKRIIYPP